MLSCASYSVWFVLSVFPAVQCYWLMWTSRRGVCICVWTLKCWIVDLCILLSISFQKALDTLLNFIYGCIAFETGIIIKYYCCWDLIYKWATYYIYVHTLREWVWLCAHMQRKWWSLSDLLKIVLCVHTCIVWLLCILSLAFQCTTLQSWEWVETMYESS